MINLENKSACVFGMPDGGKSTLVNYISQKFGARYFIYDPMNEYPDFPGDRYVPADRNSVAEIESIIRPVMTSRQYRLIVIDEANRYCPPKPRPLPSAINDLNDWRAHWKLATIYISRLPVQLNSDLTQLANYLFIFRVPGSQTTAYLNDISAGLGDAVLELKRHHFIVADQERLYKVMNPVPREYITKKGFGKKSKSEQVEDLTK